MTKPVEDEKLTQDEQNLVAVIITKALSGNATASERAAALKVATLYMQIMRRMISTVDASELVLRSLLSQGCIVVKPEQARKLRDALNRTGFVRGRGGNEQPATRDLKDVLREIAEPL